MDPDDFTFIDLFAGIGGIRIAFERAGGECVFSSEIDDMARQTYEEAFGEVPHGDIKEIPASEVPDHDILVGGWPCPSFSIMGDKEGMDDERGALFFEIERILKEKQPHAFMLENVKHLKGIDGGEVYEFIESRLEDAGYHVSSKVLNALDFGLPQKRERTIIVGFKENYKFRIPERNGESRDLDDVLLDDADVDEEYEATDYIKEKRQDAVKDEHVFSPSVWHENRSGNISMLPYSCALRANASHNYLLVNGKRHFTPREMLRLQGFPEDFEVTGAYTRIREQVGNSVPVPMIEAVAKEMIRTIRRGEIKDDTQQATLPTGE
ncbi:DNA (cytosine-5)-methyltransferase 1 [Halogranum gelatinilyticum]|uniref:DNA (Cytosine-5)-methyltransferase 1 n=1 Tax=Halogranum gelatinilyticum TaxID=660521 RepID=A0A1G9TZ02_9EURY|nr:DNA (cytosine-5-)-methyltransferase [Halogranum gelatinilyticum]SDM52848.1 DNA (cytosine-5)-methyltransferase 1 [Halogranum gelatinilyticum]